MFSRNTSKLLTFNVTSDEPSNVDEGLDLSSQDSIMSGWLLKRRRKRMQGKRDSAKKVCDKRYTKILTTK